MASLAKIRDACSRFAEGFRFGLGVLDLLTHALKLLERSIVCGDPTGSRAGFDRLLSHLGGLLARDESGQVPFRLLQLDIHCLDVDPKDIAQLEELGIDPGARAETLSLSQFIDIATAIHG